MPIKSVLTTPAQMKFVKENMDTLSLKQMAALLDMSINQVYRLAVDIKKSEKAESANEPRPVERIPQADEPKEKIVRPPAEYTNRSHEDIIDYWMNYKI